MALMENSPEPIQLTRAELFERVWATPVIRLAEQFGITNFLLAGICRVDRRPKRDPVSFGQATDQKRFSRARNCKIGVARDPT